MNESFIPRQSSSRIGWNTGVIIREYAVVRRRYIAIAVIGALVLTVAAIWIAFAFLHVTPPRTVSMATDPEGTTSAELGKRYRELLAVDGIDLRLVPTAGAVENVARLRDPSSGIDIAIISGGIIDPQQSKDLVSLGTLFYEPLWVFYRGPRIAEIHESMKGKRIGGTRRQRHACAGGQASCPDWDRGEARRDTAWAYTRSGRGQTASWGNRRSDHVVRLGITFRASVTRC